MFGLYLECSKPTKNEFSLCSSHERNTEAKFWSRRAIKRVVGFGGKGWFVGFTRYETENQIIETTQN